MIVAFGHQSRVGKDTAASMLRDYFMDRDETVLVRAFATQLKNAAFIVFGHYGLKAQGYYDSEKGEPKRSVPLAKIGKTPVDLWIDLGMKVREIYPETWVDAVVNDDWNDGFQHTLITDLRFLNEWKAVQEKSGFCVKVTRAGQDVQRSDCEFPDDHPWDHVITNDGDLQHLRNQVVVLGNMLMNRRLTP